MKDQKKYRPLINAEDVLPILSKINIFGGLSGEQLHTLFGLLKKVFYPAGEYVFRQGEEPSHIYIIESGEIKIVADEDGTSLELFAFEVGQCLGETSVIGVQPHSVSAVTSRDTELIVLSREALLTIFNRDKELFGILILNIAREACRRLQHADETLLHYVLRKT